MIYFIIWSHKSRVCFLTFRLDFQDVRTSKKMLDSSASSSCRTKANCHNVSPELASEAGRNVNFTGSFITQIRSTMGEILLVGWAKDRPRFKLDPLPLTRLGTIYRFGLRCRSDVAPRSSHSLFIIPCELAR